MSPGKVWVLNLNLWCKKCACGFCLVQLGCAAQILDRPSGPIIFGHKRENTANQEPKPTADITQQHNSCHRAPSCCEKVEHFLVVIRNIEESVPMLQTESIFD